MTCTSGCPQPGTHQSWGECVKAKNTTVGYANSVGGFDRSQQKRWDSRLGEWRDARRQGIKPASTKLPDIREAVKISNETGSAFKGY